MKLEELAAKGRLLTRPERGDVDVAGVRSDAGAVRPGDVFVLVGSSYADARAAVAEAVRRGAVAVVADEGSAVACDVPVLRAQDARRSLAFMAAGLAPLVATLRVAGVTGVSGKSSLLRLFASAMNGARIPTTTFENVGRSIGRGVRTRRATSFHAERTAAELASAAEEGYVACGVEFSSVALALGRAEGVPFKAGVFTTFSKDRADFHGSAAEQLDAHVELFRLLPASAAAIVNRDDPAHEMFVEATRARVLAYGLDAHADVRGSIRRMDDRGLDIDVRTPVGRATLRSPLIGRASASNLLGALATAIALGADFEAAIDALAAVEVVPGRMERVDGGGPIGVFVDYARTAAAFEQALATARGLAKGRVVVVFGAGGDRPKALRARLGRVADRLADAAVVTSDHPRSENAADLIAGVVAGFSRLDRVDVEIDRREAVARAIDGAEPGDVVLIAGRGPETSIHAGDHVLPCDDAAAARDALRRKGATG